MLGIQEPDSSCWRGAAATGHKQVMRLPVRGRSGLHVVPATSQEVLEFVAPARTKLCGVRWLWGLSFEAGVGAQAGWPVAGGGPGCCWFPAMSCARRTTHEEFFHVLMFQLAAGYQLILIVQSALNTSARDPALILDLKRKNQHKSLAYFIMKLSVFWLWVLLIGVMYI